MSNPTDELFGRYGPGEFPVPTDDEIQRSRKDPERPPAFRDADYDLRFNQGRWAEDLIFEAINRTRTYRAIRFGRSAIGPLDAGSRREYWRRYCAIEPYGKRPDLLVLPAEEHEWALAQIAAYPDPTLVEEERLRSIVERAVCGIESETSQYFGLQMPGLNSTIPMRVRSAKDKPVSPNIWVKKEDAPGLKVWMHRHGKPVVVVQVFYDCAFAVTLQKVFSLAEYVESAPDRQCWYARQGEVGLFVVEQRYPEVHESRGPRKPVLVAHHRLAIPFGRVQDVVVRTDHLVQGGRVIPYGWGEGGSLRLTYAAGEMLAALRGARRGVRSAARLPGAEAGETGNEFAESSDE